MESKYLPGPLSHPGNSLSVSSSAVTQELVLSLMELIATFFYSQGLGLFAARDIEKQTMVIEYNGTILRNEVALRKEKTYRSQVNTCQQLLQG